MTREEIYDLVNKCETVEELQDVIIKIGELNGGVIKGRMKEFDSKRMADNCLKAYNFERPTNNLTREFGLRQQLLYLMFVNRKITYNFQ